MACGLSIACCIGGALGPTGSGAATGLTSPGADDPCVISNGRQKSVRPGNGCAGSKGARSAAASRSMALGGGMGPPIGLGPTASIIGGPLHGH